MQHDEVRIALDYDDDYENDDHAVDDSITITTAKRTRLPIYTGHLAGDQPAVLRVQDQVGKLMSVLGAALCSR